MGAEGRGRSDTRTGTVTGSKYLVRFGDQSLLVDCGLFQGYKLLRLRNWKPLPVAPDQINAVLLTHAHLDHSGYLPLLARNGFEGKVHSTSGTRDLCAILLPDSGHIKEEDWAIATSRDRGLVTYMALRLGLQYTSMTRYLKPGAMVSAYKADEFAIRLRIASNTYLGYGVLPA